VRAMRCVIGLWFGLLVACGKREPETGPAGATSASETRVASPALDSSASESRSPTDGPAARGSGTPAGPDAATPPSVPDVPSAPSSVPPDSFAGGTKETIDNAIGLGCEAKSLSGWLELVCHKRNGTGGHPVLATFDTGETADVNPTEREELRFVLPWRDGTDENIVISWSDTRWILRLRGASAKLEWAVATNEHRHACAKLLDASKAIVAAAQKLEGENRLGPADIAKLPRFGTCYPAGLGSWAVSLQALSASGEGADRRVTATLEMVRVLESGADLRAPFGALEFAPGGLELPGLTIYDYDDDGRDEAVVSYELRARPPGALPPPLPVVWSFSDQGVAPYAKAPALAPGSTGVEQLDSDMRPDLAELGPFSAWLGRDCGRRDCPLHLVGPRFFARSLPDGSFSRDDAVARIALAKACPKPPAGVAAFVGRGLGAAQMAKAVACARVHGSSTEAILEELHAEHATLCGPLESCTLLTTLEEWAKATPPATLVAAD